MKARNLFSKVLSFALVAVMLLGLLPVAAFAEESDVEPVADKEGLVTSKTVSVEENGTYTIRLEAYATGNVTTTTSSVPTDVVLVLDVSGSMKYCITCGKENTTTHTTYTYTPVYDLDTSESYYRDQSGNVAHYCSTCSAWRTSECRNMMGYHSARGSVITPKTAADSAGTQLYTRTATTGTCVKRIDALEDAAQLFIDKTAQKNAAIENVSDMHRVSIVKFADDSYYQGNQGSIGNHFNSSNYNYTEIVKGLTAVTPDAGSTKNAQGQLKDAIEALSPAGATSADYGMTLAKYVLDGRTAEEKEERTAIVILFTDGEPNHQSGFDSSVAMTTINKSKEIKDSGATVFSISVLEGSDPADIEGNMNKYMNAVSSNYPGATATSFNNLDLTNITGGNNGYYKIASNADQLTSIFQEISNSVGSSSIDLGATAVMRDIIASSFTLPDNFGDADTASVKVYTANHIGNYEFAAEVEQEAKITVNGDVKNADGDIEVIVNGKNVDITGFSYKDNFCVNASADGKVETSGKKLIVEITGIEVDPAHFTAGNGVLTNDPASGIYEDGEKVEPIETFDECKVVLASKSYVLDYAKPFQMAVSEWGMTDLLHMAKTPAAIANHDVSGLDLTYGSVNAELVYTPKTMLWDGFDTFYAFGHNNVTKNTINTPLWAQVNVIPANNVYYEDTFVSTEGENGTPATVGIEYSGNFEVTSTEGSNSESADTSVHGGWENGDLANDLQFSDGTVAKGTASLENPAKATFTFTGTGVDVYSYTDMTTGAVRAILRDAKNDELLKYLVVDNLSETGKYYQIPTLSFNNLPYGTYTLELKVNSVNRTDENNKVRETYYLDGIRIYNPLGNDIKDQTVKDAYEDELNAVFTEVRDILIDAGSFGAGEEIGNETVNGALFIEDPDVFGDKSLELKADSVGIFDASGPKNEVYLAAGQAIAFKVDTTAGNKYYVGLKAMEGKATTVSYTAADNNVNLYNIDHSTDLYYEVVPTKDGYVMIKNAGEAMLSITKIRITNANGAVASDWYKTATVSELAEYAADFSQISSVDGEFAAPMMPPADVVVPETEVEAPEIEIEIEIETPAEPEADAKATEVAKLIETIFDAFRGWFGR